MKTIKYIALGTALTIGTRGAMLGELNNRKNEGGGRNGDN